MNKNKTIWMPGKSGPAASQTRIQKPRPEPHHRNPGKDTKPSALTHRAIAEGLVYRFLRSQPRVIGPGSLRKARPRRSDYYPNTRSTGLNINALLITLHECTQTR